MLQRIRPPLEDPKVTVGPLPDPVDIGPHRLTTEDAIGPVTPPVEPSRLGVVLALVGAGLLMQGGADALARTGHGSPALPLFLFGIGLQFAACAWRLLGAHTARSERIWVSLTLGLGLLASYVMLQPLMLDGFDELIHLGTLMRILDSRAVFPTNSVLPVSPYYPGLELATAATKWLTGLPLVVCQLIVLSAVRVVLVLGIFLVIERVCRSARAGGLGVLVYAASPQFYGFDTQYAYETLGLAFAAAAVYLLFFSVDAARPRMGKAFLLALASIVTGVFSHHVTGWLTVGFLVVWSLGLFFTAHPKRRLPLKDLRPSLAFFATPPARTVDRAPVSDGQQPAQSPATLGMEPPRNGQEKQPNTRRLAQARIVGIAAAVGLAVGAAWTVYVAHLLAPYLGPLFSAAAADVKEALGTGHGSRTLFSSASGAVSPHWEIALILASAAIWCVVLLPSLYLVVFKRSIRGGALRYLPAVIAALYPLTVLANVSPSSKEVAGRATTFIFFGVAVVVGAWLAGWIARERRAAERVATIGVATVVFLGSLLFGIGPLVSLLPGPYRVGADDLSYGSPSLALAHWADTHLPAGSHVAADRDNGVLLNAIGGVEAVTGEGGLINPELLYFDRRISRYDIGLIRKDDIRYIVVDDRLAQGLPLYGTYIAPGEPSGRLTRAQLDKFDSYGFAKRIYDNGPIKVYDVTSLLPPAARPAPAGPPVGGSGLNAGVFVLAALVAASWLRRLLSRRRPVHDPEHLALCGVVGALVSGIFGAFLIRLVGVRPEPVAVAVLFVLLVLSLRPPSWHPRDQGPDDKFLHRGSAGPPVPPLSATPVHDLDSNGSGSPSVPLEATALSGTGAVTVASVPTLYERREVKDVLAYIRILVDPDDEVSTRRILNRPKRGIGPASVSCLAAWAEEHDVPLGVALDHAFEAGLTGKSLTGATRLSRTLARLRPQMETTNPGDAVRIVADRTGYRAWLEAGRTHEAAARLENLAELATEAAAFEDVVGFLDLVALVEDNGLDPRTVIDMWSVADRPETPPSPPPSAPPPSSRPRHSRRQVLLGGLGLALFALGATLATVASLKDWTPPPELSITTATTGRSVAQVQLAAAGPVAAQVEVRHGDRTVWRSDLERTPAAQNVDLPTHLLGKGSRVVLVSDGHTLRRVDG